MLPERTPDIFSVVIIARNEEKHISACIEAAQQVTHDIVLVDSGSKDRTIELASQAGARVFPYEWKGYGANKNYGNQQALNDWIISIDGDEIISPQLIKSINRLKPVNGHVYKLNSLVNYAGTWIKHSGWYPRWKHRIFNKKECRWNDALVHEDLEPLNDKVIHALQGDLLHYSYSSYEEHKIKVLDYAELQALQWVKNNKSPSLLKKLFGPYFNFLKTYVLQLGFLDGQAGFHIAKMNALLSKAQIEKFHILIKQEQN
jgi:glycosyltransferase involved in cell wall biosynthesis